MISPSLIKKLEKLKQSCEYSPEDEYTAGFFDGINKVIQLIEDETQGT